MVTGDKEIMVRKTGFTSRAQLAGLLLLVAASLLLSAGCEVGRVESNQENVSSTTGVPVSTYFQSFYEEYGSSRVFGNALAEPFTEEDSGRLVQYFQRMRLEYDSKLGHVVVFPLGEWAFYVPDNQEAQTASREELVLKDEFLTFYEESQGASLFGPPISPELDEGGTRVQYFQNARLEWHPDAPLGYRVQVGPLGEAHYRQVGIFEDPGRNRPLDSAAVREAMVSANLRAPFLYADEQQALFVDVQTPEGKRPVIGASVEVALTYNGKTESFSLPDTDGAGHTQSVLPLPDVEPGQKVQIVVTASAPGGEAIGIATQSFRTWW